MESAAEPEIRASTPRLAHPSAAESLDTLAELHPAQGKYAGVEPLAQRALAMWANALGSWNI